MGAFPNVFIRPAVASDLDALTWIGVAAFPYEPQWPYRYPFAADFPEEHHKFTRNRYAEWLDAARTGGCIIMVAESLSLEDPSTYKVIGLSIWRLPQIGGVKSNAKLHPPTANSSREDANPLHMDAYRMSVTQAQEKYFDRIYGRNQLSLAQLATHPNYWRRGAATRMLEWGISLSRKTTWPITVFAGPTAYGLYTKFGFRLAGMVTTTVVGEEEKIEFPGMAWEPNGPEGRRGAELVTYSLKIELHP